MNNPLLQRLSPVIKDWFELPEPYVLVPQEIPVPVFQPLQVPQLMPYSRFQAKES